jgi:hypothetical protein
LVNGFSSIPRFRLRNGLRKADLTISVSANGNSTDPVGTFSRADDRIDREIRDREIEQRARQCVIAFINDVQLSPPVWRDNTLGVARLLVARFRRARVIGTTRGSAISK